jgi:hypothetical protein
LIQFQIAIQERRIGNSGALRTIAGLPARWRRAGAGAENFDLKAPCLTL